MITDLVLTDLVPSLDLLSTFFTFAYIVWLAASLFGTQVLIDGQSPRGKRSLMNQHVANRAIAA